MGLNNKRIGKAKAMAKAGSRTPPAALYGSDYHAWTLEQARALKERRTEALDWNNLAEEIEDLGRSEKRAIKSQFVRLLLHLLKWQHQPERRNDGWRVSVENARDEIRDLLADNPGLRSELSDLASKAFRLARREARAETGLADAVFPQACPWSAQQLLADDFWPDKE